MRAGDLMPIYDAIRRRRSIRDFVERAVPRAAVERMIEAATCAPNHRATEPWRFFILDKGGDARRRIGEMVREWTLENVPNPNPETRLKSADQAQREILASPLFVYVYSVPGVNKEVTRENYAAVCCAVLNFSLAAYAEGVGVGWSTGKPTRPSGLAGALGADPSWDLVAALYVGYPSRVPPPPEKRLRSCATWL